MIRWFTLILFSLGVLHASGIALPRAAGDDCATICGSHEAPQVVVTPSCCPSQSTETKSTQSQSDEYCPMSNGPCTCGISSNDDHAPDAPMPAPQRERQSVQMMRGPPLTIQIINTDTPKRLIPVALTGSIRSGFTHNQIQAILGVWRR